MHPSIPSQHIDHPAHAKTGIAPFPDRLYVVTAISNPQRYRARYELYHAFEKHVADAGAILYTVEMAFGGRDFEVTEAGNPRHVQVRGSTELWHKENLLNIGFSRLPANWRYGSWVDADVQFARPDWAQETLHQLQHYSFVQMFSKAVDVSPTFEPLEESVPALSWTESEKRRLPFKGAKEMLIDGSALAIKRGKYVQGAWHSGLAWACRREAFDAVGGLIDFAILGSADRNMSAGLFGHMTDTIDSSFNSVYKRMLLDWQDRAERHVRRNVGQVDGLITHYWHGKKVNRGYTSRWKILSNHQFNPITDIKRDSQGVWQFEDAHDLRSIHLRDDIRQYFKSRDEDSTALK